MTLHTAWARLTAQATTDMPTTEHALARFIARLPVARLVALTLTLQVLATPITRLTASYTAFIALVGATEPMSADTCAGSAAQHSVAISARVLALVRTR